MPNFTIQSKKYKHDLQAKNQKQALNKYFKRIKEKNLWNQIGTITTLRTPNKTTPIRTYPKAVNLNWLTPKQAKKHLENELGHKISKYRLQEKIQNCR